MASPAELEREIQALAKITKKTSAPRRRARARDLTETLARAMPRFEFIAHWLAVVTRKKENRGPLGLWVRHRGRSWQIVSPIGGGTVTYETTDPALLFDYARRGQLGRDIRDAETFRGLSFERVPAR